ncbi:MULTISPECIES: hypothetical protein [Serratia]|uniref:hypothetical protein n=1 Tax=Serratia TaxID=613 RepID=UPI0004993D3D|nr:MULTISPECIES: hypothetical protein [Serratia]AIA47157.1 hypothetical protein L085_08550 [Serratia sp. FS14]MDT0225690.1 hypothetical protein [Serratia marcescens]
MSHAQGLKKATKKADQLCSLLHLIVHSGGDLGSVELNTLLTLALDLSGEPACWLLEEQQLREGTHG